MEVHFGHNFLKIDLHVTIVLLPRAFKPILKNLQKFEINHLGAKMINISISKPLRFCHKFVYFILQMVYKWPS